MSWSDMPHISSRSRRSYKKIAFSEDSPVIKKFNKFYKLVRHYVRILSVYKKVHSL